MFATVRTFPQTHDTDHPLLTTGLGSIGNIYLPRSRFVALASSFHADSILLRLAGKTLPTGTPSSSKSGVEGRPEYKGLFLPTE